MRTQISIIPFALILSFILSTVSFAAIPPQSRLLTPEKDLAYLEIDNYQTYPILSIKDYSPNTKLDLREKQIIVFMFEDFAKATITIDENGEYSQKIEYYGTESEELESENITPAETNNNTSHLDNFRNNLHHLFKQACNTVLSPENSTEKELSKENTQRDGKYFMSDYTK